MQPRIQHFYHTHSSPQSWNSPYPHPYSTSPHDHYKWTANASYRNESETEAGDNCNRGWCLHIDRQSPAVAASIDIVTQTWRILYLQWAELVELHLWNRWLFMNASDLEMVSYATWYVAKQLTEAPYWQVIETYWNTGMQQHNIWSIAFKAATKENMKEVYWINGRCWIVHTQTGTRFTHQSIRLDPILFNQQGDNIAEFMISPAVNPPQSVWNSLISLWPTMSIIFQ